MNEFSCISVIAFGAARAGNAPSIDPAPAIPVILSTSRRNAAPTISAIPVCLPASAYSFLPGSVLSQQELAPHFDQGYPVIFDDVRSRIGLVPGIWNETAGAHNVDRCL